MDYLDLRKKKILVTGASSGIGQATAILLSKLGAAVVLSSRDERRMRETLEQMEDPSKHTIAPFDVRDFDSYDKLFQRAVSDGIKLSGMVHSAGVTRVIPLRTVTKENMDCLFDINFKAFMCLASKYMRKKYSNGGSIVGISAINAHYPQKCMSVYAASKGDLEAAARTLAIELAPLGIRINTVVPGAVKTPMTDFIDKETLGYIESKQLFGMENPGQIADAIAYLLSDRSSGMTGRSLFADAGVLGQ